MLKILKCNRTQGYLPRRFLPSTLISLQCSDFELNPKKIKEFDSAILSLLEKQKIDTFAQLENICKSYSEQRINLFKRFFIIIELSMQAAGFPACNIRMSSVKKETPGKLIHHIICEEIDGGTSNVLILMNTLVNWINSLKNSDDISSKFSSLYENLIKSISQHAPKGVNTLKFIQAAIELDIPCRKIAANTFQFGWGSKSRWLDSSFTDKTPAISANLAKDKLACIDFLNQAGFPTPKSYLVKSSDQAIKTANRLGYPVVVKASNLDGGQGVYCDLKNEKEVVQAFEKTKKISSKIMLEEYILGKDYRLQVCHDEVYWAIERQAPKVIGDGKNNITQLINNFNEDRAKKNINDETPLPLIELNEDMRDYLILNGYDMESIPDQGLEVKLRAANNISGGGTLIPVLDITHPDNIQLAIEITKYLRLDLAGIDLIIPDIRKSWREQKSVVLEVNAMPQISGTRHKHLLPKIISGNGRIPSILFIGDFTQSSIHQKLIDLAEVKKMNLGIASNNEARCNLVRKLSSSRDLYQSSLHLISNPTIDALTLHVNTDSKLPFILPIDRFDAIIVMEKIVKNLNDPEKTKWLKNICAYSNLLISLNQEANVLVDICRKPTLKILNMSEAKLINYLNKLFN